jgi:hypothetical protein
MSPVLPAVLSPLREHVPLLAVYPAVAGYVSDLERMSPLREHVTLLEYR